MTKKYPYQLVNLKNGLRLLYVPSEVGESVVVSLVGKVGRRAERDDEIGSAHFLEHLFFDGTAKRPDATALNRFLDGYGASWNGATGQETVEYFVKILSGKAEVAFDFLSDIFFHSKLVEIEKEKKIIKQEALQNYDNPRAFLGRVTGQLLFPGQAIGRSIFDEEKVLQGINEGVLRTYMQRAYVKENFILVVSGSISETNAIEYAEKYFSDFESGTPVAFDHARMKKDSFVEIINKDFTQARMRICFPGLSFTDEKLDYQTMLEIILGGSSAARLHERLREKEQLVYSVTAGGSVFSDVGYFRIGVNVSEHNVQKVSDIIFEEINRLLSDGITKDEVERAQNIFLSQFLFSIENVHAYADYLAGSILAKDRIEGIERQIERVKSATGSDIMDIAHSIFSNKPKIILLAKNINSLDIAF